MAATWRGYTTTAECNAIQAFKVKKWGIISDDKSINDILDGIDYDLFKENAVFQPLFASYSAKRTP